MSEQDGQNWQSNPYDQYFYPADQSQYQVSDQQYYEEDGQYWDDSAQWEEVAEAAPPRKRHGLIIGLIAGVGILIVAMALLIYFGSIVPKDQARVAFNDAVADYQVALTTMEYHIEEGTKALEAIPREEVVDSTVFTILESAITEAQAMRGMAPEMAENKDAIVEQTNQLVALTAAVTAADNKLQAATKAIYQSHLDFALEKVQEALEKAQKVYDKSDGGLVDDDSLRLALETEIEATTIFLDQLETSEADIITQINEAIGHYNALVETAKAVSENKKAVAGATYTYLLLGSEISCGPAVCPIDVVVPSVLVTVKKTDVSVAICIGEGVDLTNDKAIETCTTTGGGHNWWIWKGTRSGDKATVKNPKEGNSTFFWGTVTFDGKQPQAQALKFVMPSNCKQLNGGVGVNTGYGCSKN